MKVPIVILLVLLLFSCGMRQSVGNKEGGLRFHHVRYTGTQYGYPDDLIFFTQGKDTLNFFCECQNLSRQNKTIFHGPFSDTKGGIDGSERNLFLEIRYYHTLSLSRDLNDTAVANQGFMIPKYKDVDFRTQLDLLDKCIKFLKNQNDSICISGLDFYMPGTGDAIADISRKYLESENKNDLTTLVKILKDSHFKRGLEGILSKNELMIESISIDDGIFSLVSSGDLHNIKMVSGSDNFPDSILEFYTIVRLIRGK